MGRKLHLGPIAGLVFSPNCFTIEMSLIDISMYDHMTDGVVDGQAIIICTGSSQIRTKEFTECTA